MPVPPPLPWSCWPSPSCCYCLSTNCKPGAGNVSEEAALAGRDAAEFARAVNAQRPDSGAEAMRVRDGAGVRGVVPQAVHAAKPACDLALTFRPAAVYRDASVVVRIDGAEVSRRKHRILTPGEMVKVSVPKAELLRHVRGKELTVEVAP